MSFFWVERKLEFKTVPARWQIFQFCPTLEEAEASVRLSMELLEQDRANGYQPKAKNGGVITEYRVHVPKAAP